MNDPDAIEEWCDEHLVDLYNEGMFDDEEISEEVWDAVATTSQDTLLEFIEDDEERDTLADEITEASREWFRNHHETMIEALPTLTMGHISHFTNKPQVSQHSAEWYNQRRNRLTASEFAHILDGRRGSLLRSKTDLDAAAENRGSGTPVAIAQEDGNMNATSWGHRFESITRDIYELEIAGVGSVCDTLGRFTHATIPWLSASPDGLVVSGPLAGRLVEIKSPKTRQPGEFVPVDYYAQMQIQMEVCDLDAVDFVEAQFEQRPTWFGLADAADKSHSPLSEEDEASVVAARWKGRIEVYGYYEDSSTWRYRYTVPAEDLEDATFNTPAPVGIPLLESTVWWLAGWYQRTVLRNPTWWSAVGWPAAELFWAEVTSIRQAPPPTTLTIQDNGDIIEHVGGGWLGSATQIQIQPQIYSPE
jgi:hypothetical protein